MQKDAASKTNTSPKTKHFNYSGGVFGKLFGLGLTVFVIIDAILYLLTRELLASSLQACITVSLLPLVSLGIYCLYWWPSMGLGNAISHCKYNVAFPFIFNYDGEPEMHESVDIKTITTVAKPADIILRSYKSHLDGIIFSDNSYFTHIGICAASDGTTVDSVWHSTGEFGVHNCSVQEFCRCDEIGIFRFSLEDSLEEARIADHIKEQAALDIDWQPDLEIYDSLKKNLKSDIAQGTKDQLPFKDYCSNIILNRAKELNKTPYDYNFNFNDFKEMSCIEYVWYCHKFLYPLHRIKVDDFEFLNWIRFPVINPDVFTKNDYFSFIYNNRAKTLAGLYEIIRNRKKKFYCLLLSLLLWSIALILIYFWFFNPGKS